MKHNYSIHLINNNNKKTVIIMPSFFCHSHKQNLKTREMTEKQQQQQQQQRGILAIVYFGFKNFQRNNRQTASFQHFNVVFLFQQREEKIVWNKRKQVKKRSNRNYDALLFLCNYFEIFLLWMFLFSPIVFLFAIFSNRIQTNETGKAKDRKFVKWRVVNKINAENTFGVYLRRKLLTKVLFEWIE